MEQKTSRNTSGGFAIRALAIFGFIAVIIIGMWGSVVVARALPGAFSAVASAIVSFTSVFVPADEQIVISVPSLTVNSGETFAISWEHVRKSEEGVYTFRYDCRDGVSFSSPSTSGSQAAVFCNTPFNFLNANNSIVLTGLSSTNRFIDVPLYVEFTPSGSARPTVQGTTLLTIVNNNVSTSPTVTAPVTPVQPTTPTTPTTPVTTPRTPGQETSATFPVTGGTAISNPAGFVDLSARVLEQGVVNKETGVFTASSTPNRLSDTHRVAVRFVVENLGTRTSDQWAFNAVLPTFPSHIFSSPTQQGLAPGDRIEFTIGFDSMVDQNESIFVINVDPTGRINEPNKQNNIVSFTVRTIK